MPISFASELIGLTLDRSVRRLREAGADVIIKECSSRKGVRNADSMRVIRVREITGTSKRDAISFGNPGFTFTVELTVAKFKTILEETDVIAPSIGDAD